MLELLTAADFDQLPNRRIEVTHAHGSAWFEIKNVRALPAFGSRASAPFAVTLRDPGAQEALAQGVYTYAHPVHGALALFTVPIGPDESGMCYEVIFN